MQYVLLTATAHGLRTSLLHQAMEWPDLRAATTLPRHKRCHPHVLIRFGYGPDGARTPRASTNVVPDALESEGGVPGRRSDAAPSA